MPDERWLRTRASGALRKSLVRQLKRFVVDGHRDGSLDTRMQIGAPRRPRLQGLRFNYGVGDHLRWTALLRLRAAPLVCTVGVAMELP